MKWGEWKRRVAFLFRRDEFADDLREEMNLHLELRARKMGNRDAARKSFGNEAAVQDASTEAWGWSGGERLIQDFRQALRVLRKSPAFAAFAIVTLALGLGMNTAIFTVVNAVMLRDLPYPEPSRLVSLWEQRHSNNDTSSAHGTPLSSGGPGRTTVSVANLLDYNAQGHSFEGLAAYDLAPKNLTGNGTPERLNGEAVTYNFFSVLGVAPAMGRNFTALEDQAGGPLAVILTHTFWQRRLGADQEVLSRQILLDGRAYQVVGVLPEGFTSPLQMIFRDPIEYYVPAAFSKKLLASHGDHEVNVLGRLRPGVTMRNAQAELRVISAQLGAQFPETNKTLTAEITPLRDDLVRNVRESLWALMGASGLIVLITCINVANLLLVRAIARRHETSVRFALGASRARVMRQFLAESLVIAGGGCAGGLLLGFGMLRTMIAMAPASIPRLDSVTMDWRIFAAATAIATLTGLVFGLAPAWHASSAKAADSLKTAARNTGARPAVRWRSVLTASEVALSMVLLISAGLVLKSFVTLMGVDLGFQPDRVIAMNINLPGDHYKDGDARLRFYQELEQKVSTLPGVQSVAYANRMPMRGGWGGSVMAEIAPDVSFDFDRQAVNPGYFETLRLKLMRGRLLTSADRTGTPQVVVISQLVGKKLFGDADPIGHRIRNGGAAPWATVVGIVGDMRRGGKESEIRGQVYIPALQPELYTVVPLADFAVRAASDPHALVNAIRQQVNSIDKDQPITRVRTLEETINASVAERRFQTALLLTFAGLAVVLSMIGVFGVLSYTVTQRTGEIGLRIALGAPPMQILRMVLRQAGTLIACGAVAGVAGAYALTQFLSTMLFEVKPHDIATYGLAAVLLAFVSLAAAWLPAMRGARVDPIVALRWE